MKLYDALSNRRWRQDGPYDGTRRIVRAALPMDWLRAADGGTWRWATEPKDTDGFGMRLRPSCSWV